VHTICIVEDDEAVRDSMRALLETHRLTVADFPTPHALLESGPLSDFDCFIVDFQMPGMNGLELIEALRAKGASQCAIVISAARATASRERMARAGVIAWLPKPVPEPDLLDWIQRAVHCTYVQ
jgi:two-component system, LuxR family, response regulator FixJ